MTPRTILHVDDTEATRYFVARVLEPAGYAVREAASAGEGLAQLEGEARPDLAILDVRLPDMNGVELCRRIKADPALARMPVLMLSASFTGGAAQAQGLDAGADAYLTHPVEPLVLLATVRALFRVRDAEALLAQVNDGLVRVNAELRDTNASLARATAEAEQARAEAEQARADAEEARGAANEANRAKSDFLAMMSHELRTPLNGIGGYLQLLDADVAGPLQERQRDYVRRATRAANHLLSVINDVLNLSKVEAGRVQIELADVPVADLCRTLDAVMEPQAAAKQITYECSPVVGAALAVRADRDRLLQVLINLAGNAIKFTEPGGAVTLAVRADGHVVRLAVRDTGRGIPSEKLAAIFDPFVQVERRNRGESEGAGLGLAIARNFVRLMGGDLVVESTLGEGSTFTVILPRAAKAAGPQ